MTARRSSTWSEEVEVTLRRRMGDQILEAVRAYEEGDDDWPDRAHLPPEYFVGASLRLTIIGDGAPDAPPLRELVEGAGAQASHGVEARVVEALVPVRCVVALALTRGVAHLGLVQFCSLC